MQQTVLFTVIHASLILSLFLYKVYSLLLYPIRGVAHNVFQGYRVETYLHSPLSDVTNIPLVFRKLCGTPKPYYQPRSDDQFNVSKIYISL